MTYRHPMFPPPRRSPAHAPASDTLQTIRQKRAAVAAQIEALIDWLDSTGIDADFEPDADIEDGHDLEQCDWRAA